MKDLIKSKFLLIIALLITILALSIPAYAKYSGGSGEPNDPYLIYTAEQINEIGDEPNDWDKHFKLMIDIDLSIFTGKDFNIIGIDRDDSFVGFFDGNRHVISNFNFITTDNNFIGLFRFVGQEGEIKDLGLINSSIDGGSGYGIGSLVGENHGNITNCYAEFQAIGMSVVLWDRIMA